MLGACVCFYHFFFHFGIFVLFLAVGWLVGWLANGRQCTHVGLNLIRINGKNMRVYSGRYSAMLYMEYKHNPTKKK